MAGKLKLKQTFQKRSVSLSSDRTIIIKKDTIECPRTNSFIAIKTLFSGISAGTEKKTIQGDIPTTKKLWDPELRYFTEAKPASKFPKFLGYECVGEIVQKGSNVTTVNVGDIVWLDAPHSSHHIIDQSEFDHALILPKTVEPILAVFIPEIRIALGAIHDTNILYGDNVAVIGQGVIGLTTSYLAKLSGAEVYTFEINKHRAKLSEKLGFVCINPNAVTEPAGYLRTKFNLRKGVDSVIETSGDYDGLKLGLKLPGVRGKVVTVSSYNSKKIFPNLDEEWHKNKLTLISSMTVNNCPHQNYPMWNLSRLNEVALQILEKNQDFFSKLISHTFSIDNAKEAYSLLFEKEPISSKIVFTYN